MPVTVPIRSVHPSISAFTQVAARIASSGDCPYRTWYARFFAFKPCGYTPESVPKAIRTPAFTHFANPSRCVSFVHSVFRKTSSV